MRTASSWKTITIASLALVASLSAGCKNGFIDPTEMGRFKREALPINILTKLDVGDLEVDPKFRNYTDVRAEDLVPTQGDYVLGPNDLVSVTIGDLNGPGQDTYKNMRIVESGKISLPLVGQIQAAGLTEAQLESAIQQAYKDAGVIQSAPVSVQVLEARNRTFIVYGGVNQPSEYQILASDFRLLNAITYARGPISPTGIDYIYVIRKYGMAPGPNAPAAPTTRPNTDILAPRSRVDHADRDHLASAGLSVTHSLALSTQGDVQPADQAAPGTGPGTEPATQPSDMGDKMITVDGHAVPAEQPQTPPANNPANNPPPAGPMNPDMNPPANPPMTAPMTPPTGEPMAPSGEMQPAQTQPFEFQAPQWPNDVRIIRVPWDKLSNNLDLRYNIVIRPGDIVFVPNPPTGTYFMGGHVQRVGVYSLAGQRVTLKQAIVAAGMLDQVAIPQRTQIVRRLEGQDREIFTMVDLAKIFSGEQPDLFLKADDQVMVGTNMLAPFIAAVRNSFRITYGFGFLYDRNYWNPQNQNNGG